MISRDDKDIGQFPGERCRDHVAFGIVRHLVVEILIDREMADCRGTNRVAIGRAACKSRDADIAASAGAVLDHERLAKNILQPLGQNSRQHVGRAARLDKGR